MKPIKKIALTLLLLIFSTVYIFASNNVDGSEWDDGESTPVGNFLRVVLVIGAIAWIVHSISKKPKDNNNQK
jgi:hypothetical protein